MEINENQGCFYDYDGTYADQGRGVEKEARKAKDRLLQKGIRVCLFSGRSSKEVSKFVKKEGLSNIFIAELGTVVHFP